MRKNHIITHILSLCVLLGSYCCCRFGLFHLHGMKEFPNYIALFAFLVVAVSFLLGGKLVPVITALAYPISFTVAVIFQQDGLDPGGGKTNNMWLIWLIVFFLISGGSLIAEAFVAQKQR